MHQHLRFRRLLVAGAACLAGAVAAFPSHASAKGAKMPANQLVEPPFFRSNKKHVLDLVMIAKEQEVTLRKGITTNAWVYSVCYRAGAGNACRGKQESPLGGVRLQLEPGDTLKIHFVNELPRAEEAPEALRANPTNLHTHGLLADPHRPSSPSDTIGDYVFVEVSSRKTDAPPPMDHAMHHGGTADPHGAGAHALIDTNLREGVAEYSIQIPANHPPGLYWFHPHLHGIAKNQVTAGLAGIITIGAPKDVCEASDAGCRKFLDDRKDEGHVHHLVLKDMQVNADGSLHRDQKPDFCAARQEAGEAPREGSCAGAAGTTYAGGSWFHTINGQVFPDIEVPADGQVWRLTNASASRSYQLSLVDGAGQPFPVQVLAVDGVTIDSSATSEPAVMAKAFGGKAQPEACAGTNGVADGVCTKTLRIMPSARVELRVQLPKDRAASEATLQTEVYDTGDGDNGDHWPEIKLARIHFAARGKGILPTLHLARQARAALSENGILETPAEIKVRNSDGPVSLDKARSLMALGDVKRPDLQKGMVQPIGDVITDEKMLGLVAPDPDCNALAPGHRRRIFFGKQDPTAPPSDKEVLGLGYVEVDENGKEIASTLKRVSAFPEKPTICVKLDAKGTPVDEEWELVNLSPEDHNFHIHQSRFQILASGQLGGPVDTTPALQAAVLHDNVPLPHGQSAGCDGYLGSYTSGECKPPVVLAKISIRFEGDYVYHCHILEHEDLGMMARIRVVTDKPLPLPSR